jgi:mannan endo-1,4-beta-mannosidase
MKIVPFSSALLGLVAVVARGIILPATEVPPAARHIFGRGKQSFAKVAGRLFDIDGQVGYVAG